jgi:hypothetical protein
MNTINSRKLQKIIDLINFIIIKINNICKKIDNQTFIEPITIIYQDIQNIILNLKRNNLIISLILIIIN